MARSSTKSRTNGRTTRRRGAGIARTITQRAGREVRAELAGYIDTEGAELPEPIEGLSDERRAKRERAFVAREKARQYQGASISATKVYRREMPEFKNCHAECWMLVNEQAGTYTFANTYNSQLKASYDAEHYTYQLTNKAQKKVAKKAEEMIEVEVTEWPTWITNAHASKRKARD